MAGVGGADVVVVGDAHAVPEGAELGGDLVGELLRRDAGGGGGALDLLAVLVGAGEEVGVVAEEAVAAGDDVGDDGGVGVADVGARVDVVDRRGEVELFGWSGIFLLDSKFTGATAQGVYRDDGPRFMAQGRWRDG